MDSRARVVRRSATAAVLVLAVLLTAYLMISGWTAFSSLRSARADLLSAQKRVGSAPDAARQDLASSKTAARSAAATLTNPVWTVVGATPYFGSTPKTAAVIATSMSQALTALEPALGTLDILKPASLVTDGRIDIAAVQTAVPTAEETLPGIRRARDTLDQAPGGGLLIGQVRDARDELDTQLSSLDGTLSSAISFGRIAGPLLGQQGTKRYFLGLLNPNEARGTGGFLGTYAILTAENGLLTIDSIGSNSQIPTLTALPASVKAEFRNRYGDDPLQRGNMNISPNFPDTARIWLAAWEQKTGERLDGAMALDVVSLGQLVSAADRTVTLPNGTVLNGSQLTRFALRDIYTLISDSAQRDLYQEAVAQAALDAVTQLPKPLPMAEVFGQAFTQRRIVVFSTDSSVEKQLEEAAVSGTIQVPDGHYVQPVVINSSGSKLDAWLARAALYNVGRCVTAEDKVESSLTVDLRSDVPLGARPPDYMIGSARKGTNGPVHTVFLQTYMPNGSELTGVFKDGEPLGRFSFSEQGRPAVLVALELPPRITQRVTFTFTEPPSDTPGVIQEQPLGTPLATEVRDVECA